MKYEIRFDGELMFEYLNELGQKEIQHIVKKYSVKLDSINIIATPRETIKQYKFISVRHNPLK